MIELWLLKISNNTWFFSTFSFSYSFLALYIEFWRFFLNLDRIMAIENLKHHLILALLIFPYSFLAIHSQHWTMERNLVIFLKFWSNYGYRKSQIPLDFSTFNFFSYRFLAIYSQHWTMYRDLASFLNFWSNYGYWKSQTSLDFSTLKFFHIVFWAIYNQHWTMHREIWWVFLKFGSNYGY